MYGENDSITKFVPFIIDKIKNEKLNVDMTLGEQKRDFIYVEDVTNAFKIILLNHSKLTNYQEFQVGSGKSYSIKYLAQLIKKLTKSKTKLNFGSIPYRKGEIMESLCDNSKLIEIGWTCNYKLNDGISKVINHSNK